MLVKNSTDSEEVLVFISITSDEKIRSPSYDSRGGEESLQEGVFFIRLFVELLCPNKTYQISSYYVLKACRKSATAEAAMTRGKYVVVCGKDFMFVISLVSCLAWAR
ncbi:hypothetical protein Naga_100030g50 [Nannochloropsis gaditana]|uniref:Uncharacterized protein n=1 Tax=Nannochloropsis gaditana TaxID=72520 RepID=W7TJH7_9STRA|nr:hypothetical protein Naga_100030g50 [Nannochloropsis gaditana]